jgi:hypothetical protein
MSAGERLSDLVPQRSARQLLDKESFWLSQIPPLEVAPHSSKEKPLPIPSQLFFLFGGIASCRLFNGLVDFPTAIQCGPE